MKYLLAATLALLTFGLSWSPFAPPPLRAGDHRDLDFASDERPRFPFRLAPGEVLHVRVEQSGVDVELHALDEKGNPLLPPVDLPFGFRVTEELYLVADSPMQGQLEIELLGGYGRPRLEILRLGPATATELLEARRFVELWLAYKTKSLETLRELESDTSAPRLRTLAFALHGAVLLGLNDFVAAKERFERALNGIADGVAADEVAFKAQLLCLKGRVESSLGELALARSSWRQALDLALRSRDYGTAALVELDLAEMGWQENDSEATIRHYSAAQRYYTQAGQLASALGVELRLARAVLRHGSSPEPLARLLRGIALVSSASSDAQRQRASFLRELGWWLHLEGRDAEARPLLETSARLEPAENLQRLANFELSLGNAEAARALIETALASTPIADRLFLEITLARADFVQHQYGKARARLLRAMDQPESFQLRGSLPTVYQLLARIEQNLGHLLEAEALAEDSCRAIDGERERAGTDDEKMEYLAVRAQVFEYLTELRLALDAAEKGRGWDLQALEAAEQVRGRRLHDLMTGKAAVGPVSVSSDRRQILHRHLAIHGNGLLQRFLLQGSLAPEDVEVLDKPLAELDALRAAERTEAGDPTVQPATGVFDIVAIRRELEPGTTLLIFHLGPQKAHGWVLDQKRLRLVPLGDSATLLHHSRTFYELLASSGPLSMATYEERIRQLASWLFEPFAPELKQTQRVVVVAPAELQGLPFGALPFPASSGEPLIAMRSLVVLPSASILPVLRRKAAERPSASRALAIVDDPVYDDDPRLPARVRRRGPFRQLPDTAQEAADLLPLFSSQGGTKRFTGFEANRNQLMGLTLADFRFLHFATHARTSEAPRGLVLSRYNSSGQPIPDTLGFRELSNLSLNADLAVTTACSSALGEVVPGEGLLGVSQGFLSAGIPRLLLTLWPVYGQKTRALVQNFYQLLLAGNAPPEALRRAQMQLREEGGSPRDWAAFALHGDWRSLPKN